MRRTLSVIVLTLLTILGFGPPSHADTESGRDARHDVSALDFSSCNDGSGECPLMTVQPKNRIGDVTRFSATFGPKALRLVLGVRALNPHPARRTLVGWELHTPGQPAMTAFLTRRGDLVKLVVSQPNKGVPCPGARYAVRPKLHVYSVTLPASCLGDPEWVQVGAAVLLIHHRDTFIVDDALDPKPSKGRRLHLSERIYAG